MSTPGAGAQRVTTDVPRSPPPELATEPQTHSFIGMWVTEDGHIRYELLPDSRFDEVRGTCRRAYRGRWKVTGDIIQYGDDTGFYADDQFKGGVRYHGGYVFR